MRVVGFDPGLRRTGWGVIDAEGSRLTHVANGTVESDAALGTPERLVQLHEGLARVLETYAPAEAAVEETLVNKNAQSTLKLGVARGVALLVPALAGLPVAQYLPMIVKKAVVGTGHAAKDQVNMMVARLLPGCEIASPDSADALAVAICHAHHAASRQAWSRTAAGSDPRAMAGGTGTGRGTGAAAGPGRGRRR